MNFKNAIEQKEKGVKVTPNKTKLKGKHILINDVYFVFDEEDTEENYDNVSTLEDVLALDRKKPNILLGVVPPLFSAFVPVGEPINIQTYVNKGDSVVYRKKEFSPIKENPALLVDNVVIKSLGNMSVIIAEFSNGDFSLTNLLKKV